MQISKNIEKFFLNIDRAPDSYLALFSIMKDLPELMSEVRSYSDEEYEFLLSFSDTHLQQSELSAIMRDIFKAMRAQ